MRTLLMIVATVFGMAQSALALDATQPGGQLPVRGTVSAPSGAKGLCQHYAWACAPGNGSGPVGAAQMELVVAINRQANSHIRPVTDEAQYHVAEKWALPTARGGDCEDYALYKKAQLIEAGVSPDNLLLAAVLDRAGTSHAVLVLRAAGVDLVLDNMTGSVKRWDKTGYTFLRMQDPRDPSRWVALMAGGMLPGLNS